MTITKIRKSDNCLITEVPASVINFLHITYGDAIEWILEDGQVTIRAVHRTKRRPRLEELLDKFEEVSVPHSRSKEDEQWISTPPVGKELF